MSPFPSPFYYSIRPTHLPRTWTGSNINMIEKLDWNTWLGVGIFLFKDYVNNNEIWWENVRNISMIKVERRISINCWIFSFVDDVHSINLFYLFSKILRMWHVCSVQAENFVFLENIVDWVHFIAVNGIFYSYFRYSKFLRWKLLQKFTGACRWYPPLLVVREPRTNSKECHFLHSAKELHQKIIINAWFLYKEIVLNLW